MASIELLSSEPDLLVQIFLYLDLADLTSIEDVCTEWRDLGNFNVYVYYCSIFLKHFFSAMYENLWRKKLKLKEKCSNWKFLLKNHDDWKVLDYVESKALYIHLSSVAISSSFKTFIEDNNLVIEHEHYSRKYQNTNNVIRFIKKLKTFMHRKSEENLYFERRNRDHQVILQMLPKTIMFHAHEERKRYTMSKLLGLELLLSLSW